MIYAVYRCLYGEAFIQASINSISPYVDKIFIFWDSIPWGDVTSCLYKGEIIQFPVPLDNVMKKIKELENPKIELIYDHQFNNFNQMKHFVNDIILPNYKRPDIIFSLDTDHVFSQEQFQSTLLVLKSFNCVVAATSQIEFWRTFKFCIPERHNRLSVIFWNMNLIEELPDTGRNGEPFGVIPKLDSYVHNLGFCVSDTAMYWKHLTAIAFSDKIKDSKPNPTWLEEKWLSWDYETNNENLEISIGYESAIPYAEIYKGSLPETLA